MFIWERGETRKKFKGEKEKTKARERRGKGGRNQENKIKGGKRERKAAERGKQEVKKKENEWEKNSRNKKGRKAGGKGILEEDKKRGGKKEMQPRIFHYGKEVGEMLGTFSLCVHLGKRRNKKEI